MNELVEFKKGEGMARRWLSVREADLQRQLAAASGDSAAVTDIDRRAMILDWERHQKRNSLGAVLVRLRQRFNARRTQMQRSRAERSHDMPESEHPRNTDSPASPTANKQWNLFLASEDFAAFILYSLRIDTGDATSGLPVARWLLSQRRDADVTPTILASLFRDCAKAAIDEWQQEQRNGRAKGQTLTDAEETAAIIEALTEATESLEQCDGSDTDSVAI